MRTIKSKKAKLTAGTAAMVLIGGGAAFAYWTGGGSGTGAATTANDAAGLTAVQTSTVTGMRPGDTAQALSGNFNNPNSSPAYVSTVTVSIASVTPVGAGTCDATDYTLAGATMTVNAEVPTGTAKGTWSGATIKFNNKPAVNQDGCKGATVNLSYTIA